ncbi:hypothetical protein GOBAR_AA15819 [Gossypium barbadense]|uniref:Uncharacterized protein n=1 Tax=Gossypium barbadense TaxID=3634 RepID=A0A2P5XNF5_GOSBA|nr:hypothetical protein GOBAR_AA15819 [Gossypium barbadense]
MIVMTREEVAVEVLQVGVIAIKLAYVIAAGVVVLKGMIVVLDVNVPQRAVFLSPILERSRSPYAGDWGRWCGDSAGEGKMSIC